MNGPTSIKILHYYCYRSWLDSIILYSICYAAKKTSSASRLQVIEEPGATLSDRKKINEDFLIRTVPFIVMVKTHSPTSGYPINMCVDNLIFELHIKCLATP